MGEQLVLTPDEQALLAFLSSIKTDEPVSDDLGDDMALPMFDADIGGDHDI